MTRPYLILKRYNLNNGGSDYKLENVTNKHCPKCNEQLKRIADILEEILRIIKKDMGIK